MNTILANLAHSIATSPIHDYAIRWLRTIPGLPPAVQTVHILSIAVIMGSIVMINLRVLGFAVPSQSPIEMTRRLMPWMWVSLVLLFFSGALFVVTRPARYFNNPVFLTKFALLLPAIALSVTLVRLQRSSKISPAVLKGVAGISLLLWIGVVMAGRWIAYADYLFPPE